MQAFSVLWTTLGFKKACIACFNYPALVLTPCLGSWTFGPAVKNCAFNKQCCMSVKSNQISISYFHTWVTYGISLTCSVVTFLVGYERPSWPRTFSLFPFHAKLFSKTGFGGDQWFIGSALISWVLTIVVLPISIGFVQAIDKWKCRKFCTCWPTKCFPVVEKTELDVDNMD